MWRWSSASGRRGSIIRAAYSTPAGGRAMAKDPETRIERDSLGEMRVPADALWGASTQRAVENFPISGERFPRVFLRALGLIKRAAAGANAELGVLDPVLARAIAGAALEAEAGRREAR